MPELPEVESLRLGLKKVLIGQKILSTKILNKKLISGNGTTRIADIKKEKEFISGLKDKNIISVERRAKNIIIKMENDSVIVIHLKMTGQLVYQDNKNKKINAIRNNIITGGHPIIESYKQDLPHKHTHIIFELEKGMLYYNDVRQFGYVLYYENMAGAVGAGHFQKIGLEPFDKNFTLEYFKENIKKKNKNIKSVLLEQSIVVGCGNIYADEICFASKVLPMRNCKTLDDKEIKSLHSNIISILENAIAHGGSSISDYLLADGSRGNYARLHKVYGKYNTPCTVCKNLLKKTMISGRATVYCDICQK